MVALAQYVPAINYQKYVFENEELISQSTFRLYSTLFTICNIISMLIFILNIFDLDLLRDDESEVNAGEDVSDDPK